MEWKLRKWLNPIALNKIEKAFFRAMLGVFAGIAPDFKFL